MKNLQDKHNASNFPKKKIQIVVEMFLLKIPNFDQHPNTEEGLSKDITSLWVLYDTLG